MNLNQHITTTIISCALASTAYADTSASILSPATPEQYNEEQVRITLGAGLLNSTRYIGSNERRYRAMPTISAQWKNGWFAGFPRGIGYNFSDTPGMEYGLRLTADMGRKQNAATALNGLGNIAPRAELGAFYNLPVTRQSKIDTAVRYGAGQDSKGILLDLGMNYRVPYNEAQSFLFGVKTSYANRNYMQSYFGVDATQSLNSGYAPYAPGAGIREVALTASHINKLHKQWLVMTGLSYGRLGSVVKSAPMTRSNSHNSIYIQTNYTF